MSIVINGMDMPKGNSVKNLLIYSDGRVFTGHKDDVNYFAEELPSAQPRMKSKWIPHKEISRDYIGTTLVSINYDYMFCDNCGYEIIERQMPNYCPNCGCEMEKDVS